jgi:predicted DNA-binding antitoxin AbrB/MazE fold protein
MGKRLEALYESGVLRLLEPVDLEEHQRVTVTIDENGSRAADEVEPGQPESPMPTNGEELVAYWERKRLIGTCSDMIDSVPHARALRRQAETRQR